MRISTDALLEVSSACEAHYKELVDNGCAEDVACDRVWDALRCALERTELHCFDPRDRQFEDRLREIRKRGSQDEEL